jgi:predicted glycoside hydrolase/deacetylase ChbG (UPF0249 family)
MKPLLQLFGLVLEDIWRMQNKSAKISKFRREIAELRREQEDNKKFEDKLGQVPSHINSHKQVHLNENVIDFVLDYVQKNNIYIRKWGDFQESTLLDSKTNYLRSVFSKYHIHTSDHLFGYKYVFEEPSKSTIEYQKILKGVEENKIVEILFHPGYCKEFEKSLTSFIQEREHDRILLQSKEFKAMIKDLGFELVTCNQV